MSYISNIPQPSDILANSQAQILGNFQALAPFGNGYADFPVQGAAPSLGGGDTGLYTLSYATTGANEMYIVKPSVNAPTNIPFTASKMSNNAMAACVNGWAYLPSGILMKWGAVSATVNSVAITPTVTSGGPNFNYVFRVMLTPFDSSANTNFTCGQKTVPINAGGDFTAYCANPSATTVISYLVIGV